MPQKSQIVIRNKYGETDLFYLFETIEKRLKTLENQVSCLMEEVDILATDMEALNAK